MENVTSTNNIFTQEWCFLRDQCEITIIQSFFLEDQSSFAVISKYPPNIHYSCKTASAPNHDRPVQAVQGKASIPLNPAVRAQFWNPGLSSQPWSLSSSGQHSAEGNFPLAELPQSRLTWNQSVTQSKCPDLKGPSSPFESLPPSGSPLRAGPIPIGILCNKDGNTCPK